MFLRRLVDALGRRRIEVARVSARDIAASFMPADNGGTYRRVDPSGIVGPRWLCEMMAGAHAAEPVSPPPAGIAIIKDAIVCGEGVICQATPKGPVIVAESLHNTLQDKSFKPMRRDVTGTYVLKRPLHPSRRLAGPHVFLRQIWDGNYGHWLLECLPRLTIVAEHHDLKDVRIIVSRGKKGMETIYRDTLGAFGIRPEQLVYMPRRPTEVEALIYPLPLTIHPWIKSHRVIKVLEALGEKVAAGRKGPRRLYVSRSGAGQRHLKNEAEVLREFEPYGFTVVSLGGKTFAQQVSLFAGAEIVAGNYGANLTNAIFAPRGVTMFALTTEAMVDDFFWDMISLKGGRYFSLHGTATKAKPDLNSDFTIDIPTLRARLAALFEPT